MSTRPAAVLSATERAGERAAFNTIVRAGAEILGKLASLVLFAVLGRQLGEKGLGVYVFGLAYGTVVLIPIDLGFDQSLLREVATARERGRALMAKVLSWKLAIAGPALLVAEAVLRLIDFPAETRTVVRVLLLALLVESLGRTAAHVLMAVERNDLVSAGIIVQRVLAASIGVVALLSGAGVVAAATSYAIGAAAGTACTFWLLVRRVPLPVGRADPKARRDLLDGTATYAVQDVATLLLFRLDAVILAAMATTATVGRYGAAYRIFESTWFIPVAIGGAFMAMFTYLDHDSEPSLRAVFERGLKLTFAALVPCAVAFGLESHTVVDAIFGSNLADSAAALRILAPAVVLLGVAGLSTGLLMSQRRVRPVLVASVLAVVVNASVNVALIPALSDRGAAIAMLVTELVLAAIALVLCDRLLGGMRWRVVALGPAAAGAVMAVAMAVAPSGFAFLLAGAAVYLAVLAVVELKVNPDDARYVTAMVRRRLPGRAVA